MYVCYIVELFKLGGVIAQYLPVCSKVGNENVVRLPFPHLRPLQVSQQCLTLFNLVTLKWISSWLNNENQLLLLDHCSRPMCNLIQDIKKKNPDAGRISHFLEDLKWGNSKNGCYECRFFKNRSCALLKRSAVQYQ